MKLRDKQVVAITGAAGNLGGILARNMARDEVFLHLLWHNKPIIPSLTERPNVTAFRVDLARRETLVGAFDGVDTVVHFSGVLFRGRPEKFLSKTNIGYFANVLDVAVTAGVRRVVLISFPHVEGETTPERPATGRLDGNPLSVHAATRLEEEKLLMSRPGIEKVILRCGMVYGRGILMIDAAR